MQAPAPAAAMDTGTASAPESPALPTPPPAQPWDSVSLASFRASYPLYPSSSRMVWATAQQLSGQHGWSHITVHHAETMRCYVLRGVSPRLAKQQQRQSEKEQIQQQQQRQASGGDTAASAPPAILADVSTLPAAVAAPLPGSGPPSDCAIPTLVQATAVPPFQYVLPTDAERVWTHDTFSRLCSTLHVPSLLVALYTPPSFFTFFAVHTGIFHVLPRSLLGKDVGTEDGEEGPVGGEARGGRRAAVEEDAEGMLRAYGDLPTVPVLPPAHTSRRREKKRKQMERIASSGAFEAPAASAGINHSNSSSGNQSATLSPRVAVPPRTDAPPRPAGAPLSSPHPSSTAPVPRRPRRTRQQE